MNQDTSNQNIYEQEDQTMNEVEQGTYEEVVEEVQKNSTPDHNGKEEFRAKMIKWFAIVLIALVLILIVGFVASLFTKKDYTYSQVEDIMEEAAKSYFKDNKDKLPKDKTEIVEINTTILADHKYMKSLDKYMKKDSCSGKVSVEKITSTEYSYTAELKCGDYTTTNFYQKITDPSNVVKEGFGVYYMNNEYVYRGTDVNNYVRFSSNDTLWRIVKVTNTNEVVLITNDKARDRFSWDTRYNNVTKQTSGINTYKNSNISSMLNKLYTNTLNEGSNYTQYDDKVNIITDKERGKIVEYAACVGVRSVNDTSKNGSTECSVTENTKMSLLPVYDFINASLDPNCTSAEKQDCQNYNYLTTQYSYWLANGKKEDTSKVYQVTGLKYIIPTTASTTNYVRVVVHLSPNVMLEKGTGTVSDPYIIR